MRAAVSARTGNNLVEVTVRMLYDNGYVTRIGNGALDLFKSEYRRTGGNGTDDRDIGNNIVFPAQNADSALLERIALDIARLWEKEKRKKLFIISAIPLLCSLAVV